MDYLLFANYDLCLPMDDSKYGYDSDGQNFYLKLHHEFQKMVLISFKDRYTIHKYIFFKSFLGVAQKLPI